MIYKYDSYNRLIANRHEHIGGSNFQEFNEHYAYDYRTRRIGRVEKEQGASLITFHGGTSVAEWEEGTLGVEYIRGSDYGGGVGGL